MQVGDGPLRAQLLIEINIVGYLANVYHAVQECTKGSYKVVGTGHPFKTRVVNALKRGHDEGFKFQVDSGGEKGGLEWLKEEI